MNLRDLRYLVTVADLNNFSQAAIQCHISQPTLSSQIKKIEHQLGIQLFERTNKKVMITEIGRHIIGSAKRILQELETIEEIAEHAQDPYAGRLRLGAFPTLSTYIFPELVRQITQSLPKLKLILIEEKTAALLEHLKNGKIDVALLALPIHDDFLNSQKLFDDDFMLAVSATHAMANKTSITPEELAQQKLLLLEEGHCLRDQALDVCRLANAEEEQDFRATGLETLRQMVKVGIGITLIPETAVRATDHDIRYIPFKKPAPRRSIGLVWRKTSSRLPLIEKLNNLITTCNWKNAQ